MKIATIKTTLAASTLLLCGVLAANPTTQEHGLMDHDEIGRPMYCVVSYVILWNQLKMDPTVSSASKLDIQSRGRGITLDVLSLANELGHTAQEVDEAAIWLHEQVLTLPVPEWLGYAQLAGCREMTDKHTTLGAL
jgi:hypothetical protein